MDQVVTSLRMSGVSRAYPDEQNGLASEPHIANLRKAKFQIGKENQE